MSEYLYRVLKSSWGIWIKLTADAIELAGDETGCIRVSNNLVLDINFVRDCEERTFKLADDEVHFLVQGLSRVAPEIERSVKWTGTKIRLSRLQFNYCHFQPEGLECTIVNWAAQEFKFEPPQVTVSFDRKENRNGRYRFIWENDVSK